MFRIGGLLFLGFAIFWSWVSANRGWLFTPYAFLHVSFWLFLGAGLIVDHGRGGTVLLSIAASLLLIKTVMLLPPLRRFLWKPGQARR